MDSTEKKDVLTSSVKNTGMGVPMATQRFPMIDGVQSKVTLRPRVTGTFMNIGFIAGVENKINGNIADRLLDDYPNMFDIMKINDIPYMQGKQDLKEAKLVDSVINQLKEQYDFVPKKDNKPSERNRTDEPKSQPSASKK